MMTEAEVIRHINAGAINYISLFGEGEHMEKIDTGTYSMVKPKEGQEGISFVYRIRVENLPDEKKHCIAQEIHRLGVPFWLDLDASDDVFRLFFGKEKAHGQTCFSDEDEQYMALLPEWFSGHSCDCRITEVTTAEEFALWANLANLLLAGGRMDIHPTHHYPLIIRGMMRCYLLYADKKPVAVAATMNQQGIVSLELVGTREDYRRKGFARAICSKAVEDAISDNASLVTVRANSSASAGVYKSLGFRVYNHVL